MAVTRAVASQPSRYLPHIATGLLSAYIAARCVIRGFQPEAAVAPEYPLATFRQGLVTSLFDAKADLPHRRNRRS
jgi:hypothetical protein